MCPPARPSSAGEGWLGWRPPGQGGETRVSFRMVLRMVVRRDMRNNGEKTNILIVLQSTMLPTPHFNDNDVDDNESLEIYDDNMIMIMVMMVMMMIMMITFM